MSSNGIKCKYITYVPSKNASRKGLINQLLSTSQPGDLLNSLYVVELSLFV